MTAVLTETPCMDADPRLENRVGFFMAFTTCSDRVSWSQSVGAHQEIFTSDTPTASGRYPLAFVDPYGLCAESWGSKISSAASEWKTGIGEAAYNLPKNTWNAVTHPIQAIQGIPSAASSAWNTLKSGDYAATGRLLGNITGNIEVGLAVGGVVKGMTSPKPTTTALSPYRVTGPGETFIRYESANSAYTRITSSGGVQPGTFAAPVSDGIVPLANRVSVYNLPSADIPRPNVTTLNPPAGTLIVGPRPVLGGTGNEVIFPMGY